MNIKFINDFYFIINNLSTLIDTIGDAFVVVGGLPGYKSVNNHALACVQFALHMSRDMAQIREVRILFPIYKKIRIVLKKNLVFFFI